MNKRDSIFDIASWLKKNVKQKPNWTPETMVLLAKYVKLDYPAIPSFWETKSPIKTEHIKNNDSEQRNDNFDLETNRKSVI